MNESRGDAESGSAPDTNGVGELIAEKYRVIRTLGHGSTGTVYLCEHTALVKQVAVKVLHRELADNVGLIARFQREAQTAARLDHPNSVHVMDFGQDARGTLYLAMEHIEGRDLGEVLNDDWPLSDERVVSIMAQVLSALSAAHALGIVHRDLKPENILVRRAIDADPNDLEAEQIKVCDFGIAQLSPIRLAKAGQPNTRMPERVTGDGMVVGTPAYMSPEQARGLALDARSDLYSAGVVLFQLLTRTLPFISETPMSVAVMHCTTPPPPPSGYGPVNRALEAVCLKALSKTRDARYQTANEMLSELLAALVEPAPGRAIVRRSITPVNARRSLPPTAMLARRSITPRAIVLRRDSVGDTRAVLARRSVPNPMSFAPTELTVPAVRASEARSKRRSASLLMAAVAATLLALVAVPRLLPDSAATAASRADGAEPAAEAAPPIPSPSVEGSRAYSSYEAEPAPLSVPSEPHGADALPDGSDNARAVSVLASAAPSTHARRAAGRLRKPAALVEAPATASDAPSADLPSDRPSVSLTLLGELMEKANEPPLTAAKQVEAKAPASPEPSRAPDEVPNPQPTAAAAPAAPAPRKLEVAAPIIAVTTAPMNMGNGRVVLGATRTHGVAKANVRSALNQTALTRCYQDAQRRGLGASVPGSGSLELATNMSGLIVSARVSGVTAKPLRECIEQVARSGHVREVDTGAAQATIELKFQPE